MNLTEEYNSPDLENRSFIKYVPANISSSGMIGGHVHENYEIFFWFGNSGTHLVGNELFILKKNCVIFINKNVFHNTVYNSENNERCSIRIDDKFLEKYFTNELRHKIFVLFDMKALKISDTFAAKLLDMILNQILPPSSLITNKENIYSSMMDLYIAALLLILVEQNMRSDKSNNIAVASVKKSLALDVKRYIDDNFNSYITLDLLSEKFFVSKYYLCRMFKECIGSSVIDYVNAVRISAAVYALKTTTHTVKQISESVGFNNTNHFTNLFKAKYNTTPKAFSLGHFPGTST